MLHVTIMNDNTKTETRGRPRKNTDQRLPPISRKLFSEHCAVFYACCMVYVLEVFLKTKQEKRIGHSQGGFTLYEKLNAQYCFESFEEDIRQWGFADPILTIPSLFQFAKTVNGCAPKFVFRELVTLFAAVHTFIENEGIDSVQKLQNCEERLLNLSEGDLAKQYKYIRFAPAALRELKMDKWGIEISKKCRELWRPFLTVVAYTIFSVEKGQNENKYLRPFFSDAQHPEETIIGQLNLQQIVARQQTTPFKQTTQPEIRPTPEQEQSPQSEKALLSNKRPITLITFPSCPQLQTQGVKLSLGNEGSPRKRVKGSE